MGLPITLRACAFRPLRLTTRPRMRPVTPVSTGVFTHSRSSAVTATGASESAFAGTAVPPALSPCQPLLSPTSRELRRSLLMVMRPPRLGTSCHIRPLAFDMSAGFTMKKLAMYPTLRFELSGAWPMSVIRMLCESFGSSSPKARPVTVT